MICALDFESNQLEWYYTSFVVTHLSVAKSTGTCSVFDTREEMEHALTVMGDDPKITQVLVYNLGFDGAVIKYHFPLCFAALEPKLVDVMRLRQHMEPDEAESWGLKAAAKTFLKAEAWETELQQQVAQKGGNPKKFREFLHLCDPQAVAKYNAMDSIYTLKLYRYFCNYFAQKQYNWVPDHDGYRRLVWRITDAQYRGITVDSDALRAYSAQIEQEMNEHKDRFHTMHSEAIKRIEARMLEEERAKRKTEKGKAGVKPVPFNIGSNKQLAALICGELGVEARFKTPTGDPSFRSAHLFSYGDIAEPITTLGKREIVKNFCDKTVELAGVDGLYHQSMKIVGTVSGRLSGGGGLNLLACPRRDKGYMSCLKAPEGYTFVSQDLSSGEPTILANYSNDTNYRYIVYESKGQKPYWNGKQLMLDDLYLSLLSTFPMGKHHMKDLWDATFPAGDFCTQWLTDPEVIKSRVKKLRHLSKVCCLGLGYGMGPITLRDTLFDQGFDISENECKAIHAAYWRAFPDVQSLAKRLSRQVAENGNFLVNPFGYAMHCPAHKALNYTIQSSLNYVMNYYIERFLEEMPEALPVATIHDELIAAIPDGTEDKAREAQKRAVTALNTHLQKQYGWTLEMGLGFATGKTLYEAK